MDQQENKKYYLNKKDIIDRKNIPFLLAICPKCGNEFEIGRQFYVMYLATHCPYCKAFIRFNK